MESMTNQSTAEIIRQRIAWVRLYLETAERCNLNCTRLDCLKIAVQHLSTAEMFQRLSVGVLGTTENYRGGPLYDFTPEPEPAALQMDADYMGKPPH
jgi:hypothetical protein